MRKKLTTYIEEQDILTLKRLALEQDTSVSDILCYLVNEHFSKKIICACEFDKYILNKRIQIFYNIFTCTKYDDLETECILYDENNKSYHIKHEFFELIYKPNIIELVPITSKEFVDINYKFVKFIK